MKNVLVKNGIGHIEFTEKELADEISDFEFLKDAFLIILNEEVATKSDIPYSKEQVLEYAKDLYMKTNYCKDFIESCFSEKTTNVKQS